MRKNEIEELVKWLQEIKSQAAGPSCRQQIQIGIDFYKKKHLKAGK